MLNAWGDDEGGTKIRLAVIPFIKANALFWGY
jgi:hypothetical protein